MTAFLCLLGGLLAGATIGAIAMGLAASAGVHAAQTARDAAQLATRRAKEESAALQAEVDVLKEQCARYVGEIDGLVEATRPQPDDLPAQPESEVPYFVGGPGEEYAPGAAGPAVLGEPDKDRPAGMCTYPQDGGQR